MTTCGHCKTQRVSVEHVKMCSRLGTETLAKAASALGLTVEVAVVPTLADLPTEEVAGFYAKPATPHSETDTVFQVKISRSGHPYVEELSADEHGVIRVYAGRAPLRRLTLADRLTAEQAKAWADHNGHRCVFCGLELTDGRSTEAGYGPVCAENNGLPWGT